MCYEFYCLNIIIMDVIIYWLVYSITAACICPLPISARHYCLQKRMVTQNCACAMFACEIDDLYTCWLPGSLSVQRSWRRLLSHTNHSVCGCKAAWNLASWTAWGDSVSLYWLPSMSSLSWVIHQSCQLIAKSWETCWYSGYSSTHQNVVAENPNNCPI